MLDLQEKNDLTSEVSTAMQMRKKKQQMQAFDAKLANLADKIDQTIEQHGPDYFMVDILTMFLDVSIKMKEVMDMMDSMNMVMELIGDATTFIDESMQLQDNIMAESMNTKYNLWTRITSYFKTQAIIRNNVNRVNTMARNILTKYKMASQMVTALQGVSGQLKKMTTKMNRASSKKKSDGYTSNADQYTDAQRFLQERRAAKGGEAPAPRASQGGSAPSSAHSGGSSSGGLDLSGI